MWSFLNTDSVIVALDSTMPCQWVALMTIFVRACGLIMVVDMIKALVQANDNNGFERPLALTGRPPKRFNKLSATVANA